MTEEKLIDLVDNYRASAIRMYGHTENLMLFLNETTYLNIRAMLHRVYLFPFDRTVSPHVFKYKGVSVTWSPIVEQPGGYAYGRETLT